MSPKERNKFLKEIYIKCRIVDDINILYKYSLLIPLKESLILAIYKDNIGKITIIKRTDF